MSLFNKTSLNLDGWKKCQRNKDCGMKFVNVQPFKMNLAQLVWFQYLPLSVFNMPVIISLPSVISKSSLGSFAGRTLPVISNGGLYLGLKD